MTNAHMLQTNERPPVVVVLEATFGAVAGGIFQAVVAALASLLPSMPPHTPFALVTFDDAVHFYTVAAEGGLRQMVVADATEVCLPLPPEALLKPLGESLPQIEEMLQTLLHNCKILKCLAQRTRCLSRACP